MLPYAHITVKKHKEVPGKTHEVCLHIMRKIKLPFAW
jgi:hypothetical protein